MIYTCLKEIEVAVPDIQTALKNMHSRQGWLDTSDYENLKITVMGENHIENTIGKKTKS